MDAVPVEPAPYVASSVAPDGSLALATNSTLSRLQPGGEQRRWNVTIEGNDVSVLSLTATSERVYCGRLAVDVNGRAWGSVLGWWSNPATDSAETRGTFRADGLDESSAPRALCRQSDSQVLVAGDAGLLAQLTLAPGAAASTMSVSRLPWSDAGAQFEGAWCGESKAVVVGANNLLVFVNEGAVTQGRGPGPSHAMLTRVAVVGDALRVAGTVDGKPFVAEFDGVNGWRRYGPLPSNAPVDGLAPGPGGQLFVLQDGNVLLSTGNGWKVALAPGFPLTTVSWNEEVVWFAGKGRRAFRLSLPRRG